MQRVFFFSLAPSLSKWRLAALESHEARRFVCLKSRSAGVLAGSESSAGSRGQTLTLAVWRVFEVLPGVVARRRHFVVSR